MHTSVHFSDDEIRLAHLMRDLRVPWTVQPGHFVLDESGVVDRESPFQPGVFFVLNFEYFMKIAGGQDRFREIMLWLPDWDDCRRLLRDLGVSDQDVAQHLAETKAIETNLERLRLYELICQQLNSRP